MEIGMGGGGGIGGGCCPQAPRQVRGAHVMLIPYSP